MSCQDNLMRQHMMPPVVSPTSVVAMTTTIAQSQVFHLRALFDYDPDEDLYIPCRELGICFSRGNDSISGSQVN